MLKTKHFTFQQFNISLSQHKRKTHVKKQLKKLKIFKKIFKKCKMKSQGVGYITLHAT